MRAMAEIFEVGGPALGQCMDAVERRLDSIAQRGAAVLADPARGTITAGGKRLRPLIVFLTADLGAGNGPPSPAAVRAAVAVELVHAATLVHDDVLDHAALRRGQPTVVAAHGTMIATATGDLLFSRAFAELVGNRSPAQLQALTRASSALARGELMQREDAFDSAIDVSRYLRRCELKTARLFEASCELGALSRGASAVAARALRAFGRDIGLAFQILDDVLDVSGPADRTGKPRGADLLDGTVNLPLILARGVDRRLRALDLRSITDAREAERACELIEATGALELARARAMELVATAQGSLPEDLTPASRRALELVAEGVVERYA